MAKWLKKAAMAQELAVRKAFDKAGLNPQGRVADYYVGLGRIYTGQVGQPNSLQATGKNPAFTPASIPKAAATVGNGVGNAAGGLAGGIVSGTVGGAVSGLADGLAGGAKSSFTAGGATLLAVVAGGAIVAWAVMRG